MTVSKVTEKEQRQIFIDKWNEKDIQLVCEVPVFSRSVDLVKYDTIAQTVTAIEFKTHDWKRALNQALRTSVSFDFMEICIQKPKTTKTQTEIINMCEPLGVGVYFFEIEQKIFEHVLLPKQIEKVWNAQKERVVKLIKCGKGQSYGF